MDICISQMTNILPHSSLFGEDTPFELITRALECDTYLQSTNAED